MTYLKKDQVRFLLLEGIHSAAETDLRARGYSDITRLEHSMVGEELSQALENVHYLGIRSRSQITQKVLSNAKKLRAIGCFCIGTNQVDLAAAELQGIPVFNAPFSNTRSVAELVLAEIVFLMRGIPLKNAAAHRGEWLKTAKQAFEIRGKRLGIVGYGHIGTQLGVLAEALGMHVQYYDIENKLPLGNAQTCLELGRLLSTSDVVSLHVPATLETNNLMDASKLALMKQGSYLINASRGSVVDIDALADALRSGVVAGAAIDVFPSEPKALTEEFVSPLREFDNVILTPHVGGSTQEAQENIALEVAKKLSRYSYNGSTKSAVNFPQVSLPDTYDRRRILHIHENVPGVLENINKVFAGADINIAAQYLQTSPKVGYVVMDLDIDNAEHLLGDLHVPGTIRVRLIH
ncbi:MAG: phosphoglycerate dehydrogenase [Pseudomonadota bacterium]